MSYHLKSSHIWMPIALALALIAGLFLGRKFSGRQSAEYDRKVNNILNLIANDYVDHISIDSLVDLSIPSLLSNLDPHSSYFSANELRAADEDLNGSFSGIGISFQVINDTINVMEVIPGGPSEKAGIALGDKIILIDNKPFVGKQVNAESVRDKLRGEKNTTVEIGVKRSNTDRILTYKVTRGDIPVKSVDAAYMVDKTTGYIKVNQFGRTTYDEFITALATLQNEGALRYIVDLRGNGGGFMEMAILMVNEFLPSNKLIVYTKGRYKRDESQVWSDGYGSFKDSEVVVLIDEFSASASEIFAGAMQDNDRGLIVGCRSFGKGLVQRQYVLADSTGIRLTIARYYTPSGRCIQKDYKGGDLLSYDKELIDRYNNGEIYSRDSIKIDKSKKFLTEHGRTVYGGGGIIPDIFVAKDTSGVSPYYIQVFNANLMQEFALKYYQLNKNALKPIKDYKQLLRVLNNDEVLLNDFANFAAKNNVPPRWHYINQSRNLLLNNIKALIGRNLLGQEAFYPIVNKNDKTIEAALKALNSHKAAFPIVNKDDK